MKVIDSETRPPENRSAEFEQMSRFLFDSQDTPPGVKL